MRLGLSAAVLHYSTWYLEYQLIRGVGSESESGFSFQRAQMDHKKYTKGVTVTKRAVRHTVVSSGLETFRHVKRW